MKRLATVFKALSDETRLSMIALLLKRGELCVCDFVETLYITQSKASRHLRYLLNAGLLQDRRQGVWMFYGVDRNNAPAALLRALRSLVDEETLVELERRLDAWLAVKRREDQKCGVRSKTAVRRSGRAKGGLGAQQGGRGSGP